MRTNTGLLLVAMVLLSVPFVAQAKNRTYLQSGECSSGSKNSTWWSVTVVGDNGMPISTHGVGCDGVSYYSYYYHNIIPVSGNPFNGAAPNITGVDSLGREFALLIIHAGDGTLISCVGRNSDGIYWSAAID